MPVTGASNVDQNSDRLLVDQFAVGSPDGSNPPIEVIPDIMPVEEAAEHLELPAQGEERSRKKSGDTCFYFYQGKSK